MQTLSEFLLEKTANRLSTSLGPITPTPSQRGMPVEKSLDIAPTRFRKSWTPRTSASNFGGGQRGSAPGLGMRAALARGPGAALGQRPVPSNRLRLAGGPAQLQRGEGPMGQGARPTMGPGSFRQATARRAYDRTMNRAMAARNRGDARRGGQGGNVNLAGGRAAPSVGTAARPSMQRRSVPAVRSGVKLERPVPNFLSGSDTAL